MTLQATKIQDDDGDGTVGPAAPRTATGPITTEPRAGVERRDAAVRDLLRLLEANQRLRDTLATNAALCEASVLRLLDGSDPGRVLDDVDVARSRLGLAASLGEFERARHQARGTFISAQFKHGMNMKEIGRRWGISRQLAHRFFKEADRDA